MALAGTEAAAETAPGVATAPGPGPVLLAVTGSVGGACAAIKAGAGAIELDGFGAGEPQAIARLRRRHPGVLVCGQSAAADVVHRPALALATGARLICDGAAQAAAAGLPAGRLVVRVLPHGIASAAGHGWLPLVDADQAAALAEAAGLADAAEPGSHDGQPGLAAVVAVAALSGWLGAAVVRTRHPLQVSRALAMAGAIAGLRPPARTVRGLA
jgi:dihydropteroate synthase